MPAPEPGEIESLARLIRQHRIPALGMTLDLGPEIRWRRDPITGLETSTSYFRRIPYLDADRAGDHKIIWEPNRHQHLVVLAQAGDDASWNELVHQLETWMEQNPFQRGINWASALEVAFRALSWIRIYELGHARLPAGLRRRVLEQLYRHGCHLEANLSVYFAPNTHLLGEAVALHALGALFPEFPRAKRWKTTGAHWVASEFRRQVRPDGSHFEQSSYYHVYALDMFLFHAALAGASDEARSILGRMTEYLEAMAGADRVIPFFGDDDGGRLFHPYGSRETFARHTLERANAFLGRTPRPPESRYFENAGMVVMAADDRRILIDAGPFGPGGAGHSHSDTLSVVIRFGGEWILIDPGTFCYVCPERDHFRGTAAHNTLQVDGRDQAQPKGPFAWTGLPETTVDRWHTSETFDLFAGHHNGYRPVIHHRWVFGLKNKFWLVRDFVAHALVRAASPLLATHGLAIHWHYLDEHDLTILAPTGHNWTQSVEPWNWSPVYGKKEPAKVLRFSTETALPAEFAVLLIPGDAGAFTQTAPSAYQYKEADAVHEFSFTGDHFIYRSTAPAGLTEFSI